MKKRTALWLVPLVLLVLSAAGWAWRGNSFARGGAKVPSASGAPALAGTPAAASSLTVSHVQGHVERRDGDAGAWQPLAADTQVTERDSVRTTGDASATLVAGDGLSVVVAEQSQIELVAVSRDETKLVIERGRLSANVQGGKVALRVGVLGSDAVVDTDSAAFAVLRGDHGQVAVAVTDGDVDVSAQRVRVRVAAGEQSLVVGDRAPAPPARIPPSLFLKVARSGPRLVNQRSTGLGGTTNPGAVVFINGVAIPTDADGHFNARVELQEGKNELRVEAIDALGRAERLDLSAVTVDTQPPKLEGKTVW
ncbi:MAG: hypothetical protein RL701_278 [Pseudomonadota bacterium]